MTRAYYLIKECFKGCLSDQSPSWAVVNVRGTFVLSGSNAML